MGCPKVVLKFFKVYKEIANLYTSHFLTSFYVVGNKMITTAEHNNLNFII